MIRKDLESKEVTVYFYSKGGVSKRYFQFTLLRSFCKLCNESCDICKLFTTHDDVKINQKHEKKISLQLTTLW